MNKDFRPMLAVNANRDKIVYPCLCSNKLDGIRCIFKDGRMLARSLKPITSETLQNRFQLLKDMTIGGKLTFDGELYCHGMPFTEISHFVRKSDAEVPEGLKFHCFDVIIDGNYSHKFTYRASALKGIRDMNKEVVIVEQKKLNNEKELDDAFKEVLEAGYEGLILRSEDSPYKCGRSTVNEGFLLKIKPFETFDNKVVKVHERMENTNESQTNELGRSFRRNTKDAKKPTGIAATFEIEYYNEDGERVLVDGKNPKVAITGNEAFRRDIWNNRDSYVGKMIEYKAMRIGMKNFPRHPNFLRFRTDRDN